jgi:hypothetical protein
MQWDTHAKTSVPGPERGPARSSSTRYSATPSARGRPLIRSPVYGAAGVRPATHAAHRLLATVLTTLLCAGCGPREPLAQRLERDLLLRQKEALQRELARGAEELDSDVIVVIPASLVDGLLDVALPLETVVGGRFRITVDSGRVDFASGLALVRLSALVEAADREDVSARVVILGTLQVLDIQESGTLATRVEILGWQTQDVRLGSLSPPAGRLLDEFAQRPASDLNALLSRIEIPVRIVPTIPLPRVEEDEVTIPAVDIQLTARLQEVRVRGGRMWVHIDVAMPEAVQ